MTDEAKTLFEGSSTLLSGPPGSGKTYSLATAVEAGLKLACIFTEPRGPQSLLEALDYYDLPPDSVHWKYISPARPSWESMIKTANLINTLSFQGLSELKQGMSKDEYRQFIELLNTLSEFKCDRTGENLGPVDELDTEWMIALDGISGVNIMSLDLVVGAKPTRAMGEWGVAMDNEERLIQKLCTDCPAHLTIISHIEREPDELTGGYKIMVAALGRKLAPKLPRFFSDHVYAYKSGNSFYWSTTDDNIDTKSRLLPLGGQLKPSFVPLISEWKKRKELAEKEKKSSSASKSSKSTNAQSSAAAS